MNMTLSSFDVIVVCAGDPGGAKSLIPVIKEFINLGINFELVGYYHAVKIWRDCLFDVSEVDSSENLIKKLDCFKIFRTTCLLLGTSVNDLNLECDAINWAINNQIPSLSVVDYWSNYRARFVSASGIFYLPSAIAIMDDLAKQKMLKEGFPDDLLHISGVLSLDNVLKSRIGLQKRSLIRAFLSMSPSLDFKYDYVFVFVSQPISAFYSQESLKMRAPPFDESLVLNDLIFVLDKFFEAKKLRAKVLVRLHPRESSIPKFKSVASVDVFLADDIFCGNKLSSYDYVQAADVVFGMNSMLLLESCYLGATVVSYQPFLSKNLDVLPSNLNGLSFAVYDFESLDFYVQEAIRCASNKDAVQKMGVSTVCNSPVQKILQLIIEVNKGFYHEK